MAKDKSLKERILDQEYTVIKIRGKVARIDFPGNEKITSPVKEFFALFCEDIATTVKKEKAAAKKEHDAAAKEEETANKKRADAEKKKVTDKKKKKSAPKKDKKAKK